jgi:hypothetical protein
VLGTLLFRSEQQRGRAFPRLVQRLGPQASTRAAMGASPLGLPRLAQASRASGGLASSAEACWLGHRPNARLAEHVAPPQVPHRMPGHATREVRMIFLQEYNDDKEAGNTFL